MEKQDIINYVMNTPGNTNKMVLEGMLDSISGSGVEIITLFDDDISGFTYTPSSQYGARNSPFGGYYYSS